MVSARCLSVFVFGTAKKGDFSFELAKARERCVDYERVIINHQAVSAMSRVEFAREEVERAEAD